VSIFTKQNPLGWLSQSQPFTDPHNVRKNALLFKNKTATVIYVVCPVLEEIVNVYILKAASLDICSLHKTHKLFVQ
jgi:hypothetical protein